MICFTEVNEFIVKQWRCVLFPLWAFIFAGQKGCIVWVIVFPKTRQRDLRVVLLTL